MQTTDTPEAGLSVTRRRLLALVGWGSFAAFWGSMVLAALVPFDAGRYVF